MNDIPYSRVAKQQIRHLALWEEDSHISQSSDSRRPLKSSSWVSEIMYDLTYTFITPEER